MPSCKFRWKCSPRYLPRLRTAPWSARHIDLAESGARTPLNESAEVFLMLPAVPVPSPDFPDGGVFQDHARECREVKILLQAAQSDLKFRGLSHECGQFRRVPDATVQPERWDWNC